MVASCGSKSALIVAEPLERATTSASLKQPCPEPQTVPGRVLDKSEVISKWNRDRQGLRDCAATKAALVTEINRIESRTQIEARRPQ